MHSNTKTDSISIERIPKTKRMPANNFLYSPQHYSRPQNNIAIFSRIVSHHRDKVAVISRREILTYAGLNEQSNYLATQLRSLKIQPGSVIGVALKRGIGYIVAMFASWKIGCAYLPLDQSLPGKRIQFMMSDRGTSCLVTHSHIIKQKNLDPEAQPTVYQDISRISRADLKANPLMIT